MYVKDLITQEVSLHCSNLLLLLLISKSLLAVFVPARSHLNDPDENEHILTTLHPEVLVFLFLTSSQTQQSFHRERLLRCHLEQGDLLLFRILENRPLHNNEYRAPNFHLLFFLVNLDLPMYKQHLIFVADEQESRHTYHA